MFVVVVVLRWPCLSVCVCVFPCVCVHVFVFIQFQFLAQFQLSFAFCSPDTNVGTFLWNAEMKGKKPPCKRFDDFPHAAVATTTTARPIPFSFPPPKAGSYGNCSNNNNSCSSENKKRQGTLWWPLSSAQEDDDVDDVVVAVLVVAVIAAADDDVCWCLRLRSPRRQAYQFRGVACVTLNWTRL